MSFSCLAPFFFVLVATGADLSWWQKPETLKKVREQRAVVVVVKAEKPIEGRNFYSMTGIGLVKAPRDYTLKRILAFDELQKISPYFKKVVHQPELNRVYFLMEAYGYEARLLIKYSVENLPEKTVFHWNVVWGGFQGMIGSIELVSLKSDRTEALLRSQFDDKEIPIPKIFTSFVLEILASHVAKSLRGAIEDSYEATKGQR